LTVPFRRSQRYERYTAVKTIDIHEHAETIHFGVDAGDDPANVVGYKKALRNKDGVLGEKRPLVWKSEDKHTLDINDLVAKGGASDSAQFGVSMIEGVEKVRFIKSA